MSSPTNLQVEWARLIAGTLAAAGVREVVVSPGSRSTPLVWAVLRTPGLRTTDVIDERVAGFFALGLARAGDAPVALVCTSGSALAHYFPAVIEASESGVPLLILSADRPPEVHDGGANQTVRQVGLFGDFVRWDVDLGVPESTSASLRGVRRRVEQAVRASRRDKPGPVHLNVPARKPLEPPLECGPAEEALSAQVAEALRTPASPAVARSARLDEAVVAEWAASLGTAGGRGLIACGPGTAVDERDRRTILELAHVTGFPILAEAVSGVRSGVSARAAASLVGHVDPLLRAGLGTVVARPEVIVQIGRPLVSSGWEAVAALLGIRRVVTSWDWPDPDGSATAVIEAPPREFLEAVIARIGHAATPGGDHRYRAAWRAADDAVEEAAQGLVAAEPALSEAAAVRLLFDRLPPDAMMLVGNSLPVRHLDTWLPARLPAARIHCQRGASGIDGLIAGAAGLHRGAGRPTALLLGDVAFVHDLSGLQAAPHDGPPLVVVVLHNDGGRIFEQLPVAARAPDVLPHLVTSHRIDFAAAAAAFGVRHRRVEQVADLDAALTGAFAQAGTTVVEVRVPPHGAIELAQRLWASARAAAAEVAT